MSAIYSFLVAHYAVILSTVSPLVVAVIDYIIAKNPNSPASGILHAIELMIKGNQDQQQPPAPPASK